MQPSKYQQAILNSIDETDHNLHIEAVAGSGKTKTIEMAIARLPRSLMTLYLVFNKRNQEEAERKLPKHVRCSTFNSFGHGLNAAQYGYCRVTEAKTVNAYLKLISYDNITDKKEQSKALKKAYKFKRLVSLWKGMLGTKTFEELADQHLIELDQEELSQLNTLLNIVINNTNIRDFDDQIYYPAVGEHTFPSYDIIFVDECQDLNLAKIRFVEKLAKAGSRVVFVGDRNQAIYGFAGAFEDSMDHMGRVLEAVEMPLSICYRCSKAVVQEAKTIVPSIEWWDAAPDGSVQHIKRDQLWDTVSNGDFIICRTLAPLVSTCLKLLRKGLKSTILGREYADQLYNFLERAGVTDSTENPEELLKKHLDHLINKFPNKADDYTEIYDTLVALIEGADQGISRALDKLFSDEVSGVTCLTAHKSKGLEADNVFIIEPQLMPHPKAQAEWQIKQEKNLKFVATTRAKINLFWVNK